MNAQRRGRLAAAMAVVVAGAGLAAYAGVLMLLFSIQERLIFHASRDLYRDPGTNGWTFEDVWLTTSAGERTHGWYVPLENARGTALFSHGNAGNIADRLESMGLLRELGFSVLIYDYGGYGKSDGRPSEARCYRDIRAAWQYLTETRGEPASRILLFGRSLGGGPTIDLAAEVRPAAVVVESTFRSIPAAAQEIFRFVPFDWIVRHRFDNESKIGNVHSPLLIVHSPGDTLVPYSHGRRLYELAPEPKGFLEIHGDHNDGFVQSREVYVPGWESFLAEILPRHSAR